MEAKTEKKGGRPRTGTIVWRASGWRAVVRMTENGKVIRKWIDLETTNKSVAKRKLRRLVQKIEKGEVAPTTVEKEATRYTVDDLAKEHYERREKIGVKSWKDEKRIYDSCLKPKLGSMPIDQVTAQDIQDCLDEAALVRAHESVKKVRSQAFALFKMARRSALVLQNPTETVETPDPVRKKLPRAILSDDEFDRYVMFPHAIGHKRPPGTVDLEIKVMAIVARTVGGQRGSDVHALEWTCVDRVNFETMLVRRPKTEHLSDEPEADEYVIPEVARPFLEAWWKAKGEPSEGAIFPSRRGKRAGEAKGKVSHAHALRRDLRRAFGVDVAEPNIVIRKNGKPNTTWVWKQARPLTARERELFVGVPGRLRAVDFHSFRRQFSTALRKAKVDARDAMRLTAHTSFETHQKYVREDGPIAAPPDAALPKLGPVLPVLRLVASRNQRDDELEKTSMISSGWGDSNAQQPAPKESETRESGGIQARNVSEVLGSREPFPRGFLSDGCRTATKLSPRAADAALKAALAVMAEELATSLSLAAHSGMCHPNN